MVLAVHTIAPMPAVAVRDVRRVDPPGPVAPACRSAVGGRRVGDRVELEYKSTMDPTALDDPDVLEVAQDDVLHPGMKVFTRRNARGIADLQKWGIADPELDPTLAVQVLSSMSQATERKGAY
ncbi:MAG: hypothetical protein QOI10_4552 [Solirubrobacterales bacterium]|nr:hypothetical protein [Solirubrobacterales bacterium]